MSPKFKTRDVAKAQHSNYLQRVDECLSSARAACGRREWNASAINSIHAVISLADAMCVYFLGKRSAGEDHNDSVKLFKSIKADDDTALNANRISRVLRMKNMAEYEQRLVTPSEADKILQDAERLSEFVRKRLV